MNIVSNIRNLEKFLQHFPILDKWPLSEGEFDQIYAAKDVRAQHYDLVVAKVVAKGATSTETRDGMQKELSVGEWMVAPLVGRESSLSHSSVLPIDGIGVGTEIDYICRGGGLGISVDNPTDKGDPTKVKIMGILQYEDGRIARSLDFALDMKSSERLSPVVAVIGSCSDCGKTTACMDMIKSLRETGRTIGAAKLSGTARHGELLEMAQYANQWLDMADAGLPTTYPPSQNSDKRTLYSSKEARAAAERILRTLSVDNDIIIVEFGGDLLSANVPEILAEPLLLNIAAFVMAAESATAAIGMETKLHRISAAYDAVPKYVVGPTANLRANKNRVMRETGCLGCYDLWNKNSTSAPADKVATSLADTRELTQRLLNNCNF